MAKKEAKPGLHMDPEASRCQCPPAIGPTTLQPQHRLWIPKRAPRGLRRTSTYNATLQTVRRVDTVNDVDDAIA